MIGIAENRQVSILKREYQSVKKLDIEKKGKLVKSILKSF